jgi:hypothetical protein
VGYSVDTSALITSWRVTHNPRNYPTFWERLDQLISNHELRASEEVLEDLSKKDDDVYDWARLRPGMFVPLYEDIQRAVKAMMKRFPRIIDSRRNRSGSDPWVIALAQVENLTVITLEGRTSSLEKPRIPDVCDELKIKCIDMHGLIREQCWVF